MKVYVVFQVDREWYGYTDSVLDKVFKLKEDAMAYCEERNKELTRYNYICYKWEEREVL